MSTNNTTISIIFILLRCQNSCFQLPGAPDLVDKICEGRGLPLVPGVVHRADELGEADAAVAGDVGGGHHDRSAVLGLCLTQVRKDLLQNLFIFSTFEMRLRMDWGFCFRVKF